MDWTSLRDEFPITKNYNFQNHAGVAPLSRRAAAEIHRYVDASVGNAYLDEKFYRHAEHVRRQCAKLINANPEEVTFVKNTSEGLGLVANGLRWNSGDNLITTNVEFPANIYPWMNLRSRGVQVQMIIEEDGRIPLDKLIGAIDSHTRLIAISSVQYASGCRIDLARLGEICSEKGVFLCVDAIQALGALPLDVQAMKIDFLSADGHKWLCGPEGAGMFYCRRELLEHLVPPMVGWMCMKNAEAYGEYQFEFRDDARRFDSGSYNLPGIYGLGGAVELVQEIGVEAIAGRLRELTDRLVEGLRGKGYRIVSPREERQWSGIVAFVSDTHDPVALQRHLEQEHRLVIAVRQGRLRSSPHMYNTIEEIEQLIDLLPQN